MPPRLSTKSLLATVTSELPRLSILIIPQTGSLRYEPGKVAMNKFTTAQQPGAVDPGYTTTEFWSTVFVHLVTATVALGTIFNPRFKLDGVQAIIPSLAVVASALAQMFYSHSRAGVKAAAQEASSKVATALVTTGTATSNGAAPPETSSLPAPAVYNFTLPSPANQ
jgi:hypothetical protein